MPLLFFILALLAPEAGADIDGSSAGVVQVYTDDILDVKEDFQIFNNNATNNTSPWWREYTPEDDRLLILCGGAALFIFGGGGGFYFATQANFFAPIEDGQGATST